MNATDRHTTIGAAIDAAIEPAIDTLLDGFDPIDLDRLDRVAKLRTRKDRKYVLTADELGALLESLSGVRDDVRILDIDGCRWFRYESIYFDTERFDSYRLAAHRRPQRFKARVRQYVDADVATAEVKTKNRRGRTHKHRRTIDDHTTCADAIRSLAAEIAESAVFADELTPVLTSRYRRATLAFPADGVRVTIDAAYRCIAADGTNTALEERFIVETKTGGGPSLVDRTLWRAGHRPEKISKYATGLAALRPGLPANRWHPVLREHFAHSPRHTDRATHHPERAVA